MTVEDAHRWNEIHRERDLPVPSVPAALDASGRVDLVPTSGRALDVACGSGGPAVWLAERGLAVLGIDASSEATGRARALADAHGLSARARFDVVDLDAGLPSVVVEEGPFDLVLCQRFRDPNLYEQLVGSLAPGGLLVITVLSTVGHAGDPSPYRAEPGELDAALAPLLDVLWSAESNGSAHLIAIRGLTPNPAPDP